MTAKTTSKKRRSKDEIAAEKAARQARREARAIKLAARLASAAKYEAAIAKRKAHNEAVAASVERRLDTLASQREAATEAAAAAVDSFLPNPNLPVRTRAWKTEVFYFLGLSTDGITTLVYGHGKHGRGSVNAVIRDNELAKKRDGSSPSQRIAALLDMERNCPDGMSGFVIWAARQVAAMPMRSSMPESERKFRADLIRSLTVMAEKEDVRTLDYRGRGRVIIAHNTADCALSWMEFNGTLAPSEVQAGLMLRRDFQTCGGAIAVMDYSKPKVDGSGSSEGAGRLDALQRFGDALASVRFVFKSDPLLAERLKLLDHVVVQNASVREFMGLPKDLQKYRAQILSETLEPVAVMYEIRRDGDVYNMLQKWLNPTPEA